MRRFHGIILAFCQLQDSHANASSSTSLDEELFELTMIHFNYNKKFKIYDDVFVSP